MFTNRSTINLTLFLKATIKIKEDNFYFLFIKRLPMRFYNHATTSHALFSNDVLSTTKPKHIKLAHSVTKTKNFYV